MLTLTKAIAIAPAISSKQEISSSPASSSTPAGLSAQRPPSLRESPGPSSRTLKPTQHNSHRFPWLYPNVCTHVYPERAGIPKLDPDFPRHHTRPPPVKAAVSHGDSRDSQSDIESLPTNHCPTNIRCIYHPMCTIATYLQRIIIAMVIFQIE